MKTTISLNNFINNTQLRDNFSYDALVALFNYIEEYEQSCEIEIDFDPVALRCEYIEYTSIKEAYESYACDDEELTELEMLECLQDRTQVIEFDAGVILQNL